MNENLKKILSASIDGYIYHTDEAERIVSDLTKLTSAELDPTKDSYILQNIDAYLEFLEQKDMDKEAVTCGEYIGILDSFVNDPGANEDEKRELVIRQRVLTLQSVSLSRSVSLWCRVAVNPSLLHIQRAISTLETTRIFCKRWCFNACPISAIRAV